MIPRIIGEAAAGRYAEPGNWITAAQGASTFSGGLRLSLWFGEEAPFENLSPVTAQTEASQRLRVVDERTAPSAMCAAWNVVPAPAVENTAVHTDIPSLILAGEFDPSTPPQWGRRLLANMPAAYFVDVPGLSHSASFNRCGGRMAFDFIGDPTKPRVLTCVAQNAGVSFAASADDGH